MAKAWSVKEDCFLLTYHKIPGGPNFVASHDLGRPHGAGERRMKKLIKLQAWSAFVRMQMAELKFLEARGEKLDPWALENLEADLEEAIEAERKANKK